MNWIVTWIVITTSWIPCTPIENTWTDDYGRTHTEYNLTLEACFERTETPMQRSFYTYQEAKYFYDNGIGQYSHDDYPIYLEDKLCCFKIKEIGDGK